MEISSPQLERQLLGSLLRFPEVFADIDRFINENDFCHRVNSTIFNVIKRLSLAQQEIDKVLVADTIKNMSISFEDDINIFDYVESLSLIQINRKAAIETAKQLKKTSICREIQKTGIKLAEEMKHSLELSVEEIISKADGIYNKQIELYNNFNQPEDLFAGMYDLLEELGNNPENEVGIQTPYADFNNIYGGLLNGNLYAIVSRPSEGKSNILGHMAYESTKINKGLKVLILDTEMTSKEVRLRVAAAITGVPMWYLASGNWRKNEEMTKKVRASKELIDSYFDKVEHIHVAGKPIEEVSSIIRRWYLSRVGRNNKALVIYDYIKLTGEKISNDWKEYQAIGEKCDKLKQLARELNIPIFTACQLNRSAEGVQKADDSSAIAQSDRLQWFASFVAIFRRKSIDEMTVDGIQFGNHKMIPLKTRFQGKEAAGHHDLVRIPTTGGKFEFKSNFINFQVENFDIKEMGTLRQMVAQHTGALTLTPQPHGNLL